MRKALVGAASGVERADGDDWLDLERLAVVEVSSEQASHPVEAALLPDTDGSWRAATPGPQTLRLVFDEPQTIRRILVEIDEPTTERTQEMTIAWWTSDGERHEHVRQRWNFSPRGSVHEREDYHCALAAVSALEIVIDPNVTRGQEAVASITRLRIA